MLVDISWFLNLTVCVFQPQTLTPGLSALARERLDVRLKMLTGKVAWIPAVFSGLPISPLLWRNVRKAACIAKRLQRRKLTELL